MPRTRDLILFAVCAIFLVTAINITWFLDTATPSRESVTFRAADDAVSAVAPTEQTLDRDAIISALREKLRSEQGVVLENPSVTTDADAAEAVATSTDASPIARANYCLYADDTLPYIGQWPLNGTEMAVAEGMRVFYTEEEVILAAAATSTEEDVEVVRNELLALPTNPVYTGGNNCLPSEVIGVTTGGILLFNDDSRPFASLGAQQLVGYARDGFPIYGRYDGEVDACGGYQHPAGYRYTISADRDYIIGCYQGAVQSFTF